VIKQELRKEIMCLHLCTAPSYDIFVSSPAIHQVLENTKKEKNKNPCSFLLLLILSLQQN
jgi:hypothetical protein